MNQGKDNRTLKIKTEDNSIEQRLSRFNAHTYLFQEKKVKTIVNNSSN